MAKINYIKINGTIRYLETISYQTTLPTATSDSADLVSVNNKIYVKQVVDGVYSYAEIGGGTGGGIEIIDINGVSTLASDYQSIATLSTAYLLRNDLFYKLESEDSDYLYFTNNYELAYNRISINKNDWSITQAETINVDRVFGVEITDVPETATNGTLTETQLATLQASDSNYIMFANEKYYLNDKGHTEGYLTYSHVGAQSDEIYLKTITITISTRGWVLLEQKAGGLTTDTAYVENSTLYISEGTTAASGGTSKKVLEIDLTTHPDSLMIGKYLTICVGLQASGSSELTESVGADIDLSSYLTDEEKTNFLNNVYDEIVLKSHIMSEAFEQKISIPRVSDIEVSGGGISAKQTYYIIRSSGLYADETICDIQMACAALNGNINEFTVNLLFEIIVVKVAVAA